MKKVLCMILALCFLVACAPGQAQSTDGFVIAATTLPVAQFTEAITAGTDVAVQCIITGAVSCLHDYTLSVEQITVLENADAVVISGLGLEDFMQDILPGDKPILDASEGVEDILPGDPHIWLDPDRAEDMAETIANGLCRLMPENTAQFQANLQALEGRFDALDDYAEGQLRGIRGPGLVTFHDGFRYFADFIDMPLLAAMEVEAGSEPSARELEDIISLVNTRNLPAVFTEVNGAADAAEIVHRETGCNIFNLDMAMENDYFAAMEHNIETIREAFQ